MAGTEPGRLGIKDKDQFQKGRSPHVFLDCWNLEARLDAALFRIRQRASFDCPDCVSPSF